MLKTETLAAYAKAAHILQIADLISKQGFWDVSGVLLTMVLCECAYLSACLSVHLLVAALWSGCVLSRLCHCGWQGRWPHCRRQSHRASPKWRGASTGILGDSTEEAATTQPAIGGSGCHRCGRWTQTQAWSWQLHACRLNSRSVINHVSKQTGFLGSGFPGRFVRLVLPRHHGVPIAWPCSASTSAKRRRSSCSQRKSASGDHE